MPRPDLTSITGAVLIAVATTIAIFAPCVADSYWRGLLANLATTLFGVGLAILIVNVVLHSAQKRRAIAALTILTGGAISSFLQRFGAEARRVLDEAEFLQMTTQGRSITGGYDLSDEACTRIANRYRARDGSYDRIMLRVRNDLRYLALLLGWSFDPNLLWHLFAASHAIRRFRRIRNRKGTDGDRLITERLFDAYIQVAEVRTVLRRLSKETRRR